MPDGERCHPVTDASYEGSVSYETRISVSLGSDARAKCHSRRRLTITGINADGSPICICFERYSELQSVVRHYRPGFLREKRAWRAARMSLHSRLSRGSSRDDDVSIRRENTTTACRKGKWPPFDIYLIVMLNVSGQCSDKGSFLHHRDPADVVSPFSYLAFVVPTIVF